MAYTLTVDERYGGTFISRAAGYYDAPSILNSIYVLKPDDLAYGTLTYNNSILDQDVYSLGSLSTGYYKIDVNDQTWDFSNYDYGSVASFSVLDGSGNIVDTSYGAYSDINFSAKYAGTYYVKLTGIFLAQHNTPCLTQKPESLATVLLFLDRQPTTEMRLSEIILAPLQLIMMPMGIPITL